MRFEYDEYIVDENSSLVNVHLQAVQEDPPNSEVYIKAKYTFDFDVSLITLAGSAKGGCGHDYIQVIGGCGCDQYKVYNVIQVLVGVILRKIISSC